MSCRKVNFRTFLFFNFPVLISAEKCALTDLADIIMLYFRRLLAYLNEGVVLGIYGNPK